MKCSGSLCLVAIGMLALATFAVGAASLEAQSLWRDEVDALRFATAPWTEVLANLTRPGWNGPLYFLFLRGWIALAGRSEYALRFFSLACGVLGVPLVYALGRRLFDRRVGLVATLLISASPYLAWYGQELKMYTLVPALAMLAIYGLRRAVEGDGWRWWVVQIVATSLAFYSHILAALLIPVQVLLYLSWWPQARRQWINGLCSLACLTLPYLPLAVWQAPLVLQARETGFHPYALGEMVEILLNGWSTGILNWGWPWGTVLMGALAAWGLLDPLGTAPVRHRLALLGWLAVPLVAVWLVSLRQPLFTDRYLIWTAPAFYLLVALGLVSLVRLGGLARWALLRALGRAAVVSLVCAVLVVDGVNLWRQATVPIKSDFRAAAAYVAGRYTPGELLVFQIPYARYTFDYYFPVEAYPWAEGSYTNHRTPDGSYLMSERDVERQMQEMVGSQPAVWLIVTEMEMWDQRGLVRAWLEANMRRADEAHFARVDVYRYVK